MKKKSTQISPTVSASKPDEDAIRDYAFHLYVQSGCTPGRDEANWLEAEACLSACIPKEHSHARLHRHLAAPDQGAKPGRPEATLAVVAAGDTKHLAA